MNILFNKYLEGSEESGSFFQQHKVFISGGVGAIIATAVTVAVCIFIMYRKGIIVPLPCSLTQKLFTRMHRRTHTHTHALLPTLTLVIPRSSLPYILSQFTN